MIYLDHASTTPLHPEVRATLLEALEAFGNPGSLHAAGRQARRWLEDARREVAALVGALPAEVIFTASGTESNNMVLRGVVDAYLDAVPVHLVVSGIEHPCIRNTARYLAERRPNVTLTEVAPAPDGRVMPDAVAAALTPHTRLVSVMMVNNETGALQPVEEIARVARTAGVPFHTDACQAPGRVEVAGLATCADAITLCAHKMYGPRGAAALVLREGVAMRSLLLGGGQERERRAGTENTAALAAMGTAARLARLHTATWAAHTCDCEAALLEAMASEGLEACLTLPPGTPRAPGIMNLAVPPLDAEDLMIGLDLAGVGISTGSACNSGSIEPSTVLRAMGLTPTEARRRVRISAGLATAPEDMPKVARFIAQLAQRKGEGELRIKN